METPVAETQPRPGVIGENWPTLARAMSRYDQRTAETFSQMAYDAVCAGIIRLDDRERLASAAADMGIRPFDAQLLIACAIRKWAIDRQYDPTPTLNAPQLSYEYKTFRKVWLRAAIMVTFAVALDVIIILKWFR